MNMKTHVVKGSTSHLAGFVPMTSDAAADCAALRLLVDAWVAANGVELGDKKVTTFPCGESEVTVSTTWTVPYSESGWEDAHFAAAKRQRDACV
jgi:hypothetical protein